jgi:hypothetical protein
MRRAGAGGDGADALRPAVRRPSATTGSGTPAPAGTISRAAATSRGETRIGAAQPMPGCTTPASTTGRRPPRLACACARTRASPASETTVPGSGSSGRRLTPGRTSMMMPCPAISTLSAASARVAVASSSNGRRAAERSRGSAGTLAPSSISVGPSRHRAPDRADLGQLPEQPVHGRARQPAVPLQVAHPRRPQVAQ